MPDSRTVFSASDAYFSAAAKELLGVFEAAHVERLGPDTGCLHAEGAGIADVADMCRRQPLVFVRHLMREEARIAVEAHDAVDRVAATALDLVRNHAVEDELAVRVWMSGAPAFGWRPEDVWRRIAGDLGGRGLAVARAGRAQVLSICATPKGIVVGSNRQANALTDWPGGRVRLARDDGQISRAEFKLEEALAVFGLELPADGESADLGASPGGWTRILRRRGLSVWAVDPADVDPRVAADPGVRHARTTAGRFLAETDRSFDLVVNDMRMTAARSCEVMLDAAKRLKPDGLGIMTLKLSPRDPLATVRASLAILRRGYEVLHARQLYHNRNEVTVILRCDRGDGAGERPRGEEAWRRSTVGSVPTARRRPTGRRGEGGR